ncbi:MAG: sensor histidine kinase [Spirochaetaceae bacterium]
MRRHTQPTPNSLVGAPDERSEVLESLLEAIGVPFLVVDRDLRLRFFSASAGWLFPLGISNLGEPLTAILPRERRVEAAASVAQALDSGNRAYARLHLEDGYEYKQRAQPLETADGTNAGAVVTYSRRPEGVSDPSGLDELSELHLALFAHSPDLIVRVDQSQRIIHVNRAAASMIGVKPDELFGRSAATLAQTGALPELWLETVEQVLKEGRSREMVPASGSGTPGSEFLWRFLPEFNEFGVPHEVLCRASDVGPLKREERRLQRLLEERESELRELHHRTKNELFLLAGNLYREVNGSSSDSEQAASEQAELRRTMQSTITRTRSLAILHDTLASARRERTEMVQLPPLLEEIVASLVGLGGSDHPETATNVETDLENLSLPGSVAATVGEITAELVTNALQHAFPTENEEPGKIRVCLHRLRNAEIELTVSDDGVGIGPTLSEAAPESEGAGLLLTRQAVRRIHGRMQIENAGGTLIRVTIPLADRRIVE